jgi:hypothetical protein
VALPRGDAAGLPERNNADDIGLHLLHLGTTARPKIVVYNHGRLLDERPRSPWNS